MSINAIKADNYSALDVENKEDKEAFQDALRSVIKALDDLDRPASVPLSILTTFKLATQRLHIKSIYGLFVPLNSLSPIVFEIDKSVQRNDVPGIFFREFSLWVKEDITLKDGKSLSSKIHNSMRFDRSELIKSHHLILSRSKQYIIEGSLFYQIFTLIPDPDAPGQFKRKFSTPLFDSR